MSRIAAGSSDAVRISKLDPLDSDYESAWDFTKLQATKPSVTNPNQRRLGLLADNILHSDIASDSEPGNEDEPIFEKLDLVTEPRRPLEPPGSSPWRSRIVQAMEAKRNRKGVLLAWKLASQVTALFGQK